MSRVSLVGMALAAAAGWVAGNYFGWNAGYQDALDSTP